MELKEKSPYMFNLTESLKNHHTIVNYGIDTKYGILDCFKFFFKSDILYFNWIEDISVFQIPFFILMLILTKFFKKKIVWTHHNVHPHRGRNFVSMIVMNLLQRCSDIIVIHTETSKEILGQNSRPSKVFYYFHPFFQQYYDNREIISPKYDLLIWGNVRKSKGVDVFLEYLDKNGLLDAFRIRIIGRFSDTEFFHDLKKKLSMYGNIEIDNEFVDDVKLKSLHMDSRYVLFIYTGTSVLNSGALIKSLPWGTSVIGPNAGAFKELAKDNAIFSYNDFGDIIELLQNKTQFVPNVSFLADKIENSSWNEFVIKLSQKLKG